MPSISDDSAALRHDQLRVLSDRSEIGQLCDRYAMHLDRDRDDDAWLGSVFTDDACLTFPFGEFKGMDGLAAFQEMSRSNFAGPITSAPTATSSLMATRPGSGCTSPPYMCRSATSPRGTSSSVVITRPRLCAPREAGESAGSSSTWYGTPARRPGPGNGSPALALCRETEVMLIPYIMIFVLYEVRISTFRRTRTGGRSQ